jgi:hypothetical protein
MSTQPSNSWFCVGEDGTQRALEILPLAVCVGYAFLPLFILMFIFIKPVPVSPTTEPALGASGDLGQPATVSESSGSLTARLEELTRARDAGLITNEEFEKKKAAMVSAL